MNLRSTLTLAALTSLAPLSLAAQVGTSGVAPDWSPEPKSYATTAALFADSIFASWDGEAKVTLRIRVLEIVGREPDRYMAGREITLEPGSGPLRLGDLLPARMIGRSAPVLRWTNEVFSVPGSFLGPSEWKPEHLEALTKNFPVDWEKEALLLIALTAVEERDLDTVSVVPLLVVRPYVVEASPDQ